MSSPCPDNDVIQRAVGGALRVEERDSFERHIDGCASCRASYAALLRMESPLPSGDRAAPLVTLEPGTRFGRFTLRNRVGVGSSAQVWAAHDDVLDRVVALKVVSTAVSEETRESIWAEARLLARLPHRSIVTLFDLVVEPTQLILAMEFANEGSARRWVTHRKPHLRSVLQVFLDAGAGLARAHRLGIIHRDVKPDNVLVLDDGRGVLADFGLALVTTIAVGTRAYAAPEVLAGGQATAASDQFSFCASLSECLAHAGRVPRPLRDCLARGQSVDPSLRYPTMEALLEALRRASTQRRRWVLLAAAVAVLAGVGLAGPLLAREQCVRPVAPLGSLAAVDGLVERDPSLRPLWAGVRSQVLKLRDSLGAELTTQCEAGVTTGPVIACLENVRATLAALDTQLAHPTRPLLNALPLSVEGIRTPESCRGVHWGDDLSLAPNSPLGAEVASAKLMRDLGLYAEADEAAAKLIEAARQTGFKPVAIQALSLRGDVAIARRQLPEAEAFFWEAIAEGSMLPPNRSVVEAWVGVSRTGVLSADLATMGHAANVARAMAQALGDGPDLYFPTAYAVAMAHQERAEIDEALATYDDMLRVLDGAERPYRWAWVRLNKAVTLEEGGRCEASVALLNEVLPQVERSLGPTHPMTARGVRQLANCQYFLGDKDAAFATATRAMALMEAALGPQDAALAYGSAQLALSQVDRGDLVAATSHVEAMWRSAKQGSHRPIDRAFLSLVDATVALERGDAAKARSLVLDAQPVMCPSAKRRVYVMRLLGRLLERLDLPLGCVAGP